jgi:hypothetical protein
MRRRKHMVQMQE